MKRVCMIKTVALLSSTFGLLLPALAQTTNAPQLAIQLAAANSVSLTLTGAVLTSYSIQASTNLSKPMSFSTIGVVLTDTSGRGSFTEVGSRALYPQRFYRAQQFP